MDARELLKKLGIAEPTDEQASIAETFAKDYSKGVEDSMQKRINSLTKEKHNLSDEISGLKAEKAAFDDKYSKLQNKYDTDIAQFTKYKEQFEEIQTKRAESLKSKWVQALAKLNVPETDKRYENAKKVKDKLGIVDLDKPEELQPDQIEKKLEIYDIYAETGFIDKVEGTPPPETKKGETKGHYTGGVVAQAVQRLSGSKPK